MEVTVACDICGRAVSATDARVTRDLRACNGTYHPECFDAPLRLPEWRRRAVEGRLPAKEYR